MAACTRDYGTVDVRPVGSAGSAEPSTSAVPDSALKWTKCNTTFQCALLSVPIDYANPSGQHINVSLIRHLAPAGRRIGSLLVNPGGPGASGVAFVRDGYKELFSNLGDRFDIVGWDPRGVGGTIPVDCVDDLDPYFGDIDPTPDNPQELQQERDAANAFAAACGQRNSSTVLAHVSTQDTARDMDSIRQALGEAKISYFGFSYGSELGAAWATMFPATVRAAALDGAADPSPDPLAFALESAAAADQTLDRLLTQCSHDPKCPFNSNGQASAAFDSLMQSLDAHPLPTSDPKRSVGQAKLFWAMIETLYSPDSWPALTSALAKGAAGQGQPLLDLYDAYFERDPKTGRFPNLIEANVAISCADNRTPTTAEFEAKAKAQLAAAAPRTGLAFFDLDFCRNWPTPVAPDLTITGKGAGTIVVVGATGDPVTPLTSSRKMAEALEGGVLLIRQGEGHTSYNSGNACIRSAIDRYFISGTAPSTGTQC
ncbi:MAG: hypothetical protein JWL70_2931 [Acidimicrobiia bacterium]|nr:hypothetical protein [Acidimicrobiia bacterium]